MTIHGQILQIERNNIMARHGENIRKRKDGRWEGRYLAYDKEKEKKIYHSIYGKTYEEVKEKMDIQKKLLDILPKKVDAEAEAKKLLLISSVLFKDMAEEWLDELKNKKKLSTYVKYDAVWHNYLEELLKEATLAEITETFMNEKLSNCTSNSVLKSVYCVLNQVLKFASKRYCVNLPSMKKPSFDIKNKPIEVLGKKEQKELLSVIYNEMDIFKMAVLLCLHTGIRLGELCALKWEDIDFENKVLLISRTVQRLYADGHTTKTILLETEPKSEYSNREIPLNTATLELLAKFQDGKEYIFGKNKPMEPRTLQYHFKKILEEAGLPDKNFHILRHTFATNCIDGGTDVKSLSEILGHSDVQITLNRYVHPSMDTKRKHMDGLSSFYGQIYGQTG